MLVCSPVQAIPGVEHLVQISNFLNQKNPISIYFCHCLTRKIKAINQLIKLVVSSHSQHKAEWLFTIFKFWTWLRPPWESRVLRVTPGSLAVKRTPHPFSSPSPQPHSLPAQKTWSRIMQIWQVCRVSPDRTCHKSFQTGAFSVPSPNSSFWEKLSEQQLLLPLLS